MSRPDIVLGAVFRKYSEKVDAKEMVGVEDRTFLQDPDCCAAATCQGGPHVLTSDPRVLAHRVEMRV